MIRWRAISSEMLGGRHLQHLWFARVDAIYGPTLPGLSFCGTGLNVSQSKTPYFKWLTNGNCEIIFMKPSSHIQICQEEKVGKPFFCNGLV